MSDGATDRGATFREVLAVGEFRALFLADVQSVAGDQLARVALSILVFQRTNSAGLTALTYALTFLPDLVGGPLLAGLADRYPRRQVMVVCELARAGLVGLMVVPGLPLPILALLVVVAQLFGSPFMAAQIATLPAVLEGDRFDVGQAMRQVAGQAAQVVGFAVGGALVAMIGAREALGINAATFVVSAMLIGFGVRNRPAPPTEPGDPTSYLGRMAAGMGVIWRSHALRSLVGLAWLAAFVIAPEGLAAVYAAEIGAGQAAVGVLLAAHPLGLVLGAIVVGRILSPMWRQRLMAPLAVLAVVPLLAFAARPGVEVSVVLLAASGFCGAYQITASTTFTRLVPDSGRGQALGLVRSGLIAVQGLGVAAAGLLAQSIDSAATAIFITGCAGVIVGLLIANAWRRAQPTPRPITNSGYGEA